MLNLFTKVKGGRSSRKLYGEAEPSRGNGIVFRREVTGKQKKGLSLFLGSSYKK